MPLPEAPAAEDREGQAHGHGHQLGHGPLVEDPAGLRFGTVYGVDWEDVPDRDAREVAVREQLGPAEVTRARKLEGMWWGDGGAYIVSSYAREESPGAAHDGQVWFYDPKRRTLTPKVLLGGCVRLRRPRQHHRFARRRHSLRLRPGAGLLLAITGPWRRRPRR